MKVHLHHLGWLLLASNVESLLTSLSCIRGSNNGPRKTPRWISSKSSSSTSSRRSVALSMGIRSLLKKLKDGENEDDDVPQPPPRRIQPIITARYNDELEMEVRKQEEQEQEIVQQKLTPAPLRMGETSPGSGVVDAATITEEESIQDKINRVKSGQMTEEEKRAFLATALSAGMTPVSRKPLITPKQRLEKASASPFPTDSILRNFVSGKVTQQKKDVSLSSISIDLNTDAKKKEYLDMVTDPDRFTRRIKPKTSRPPSTTQQTPPTQAVSTTQSSWVPAQPQQQQQQQSPVQQQQSSPPQQLQQPNGNAGRVDDLGARLGMYAMEEEVRRRDMEKQRAREKQEQEERERYLIMQKQEAEQRAAEVARRQQLALLQVEEQVRRKEEEEELRRKEEEMAAEQERLASLIKQQEAYWTERLAKEKESKAKREQAALLESKKQKEQVFEYPSSDAVPQQPAQNNIQPPAEHENELYAPMQRETFNPNEMDLLEEAKHDREVDWQHNQKAIQWGATHTPGLSPPPSPSPTYLQTELEFMEEQARKKAEIDRAREEQFLRLKEMNSPLPSPVIRAPAPPPATRPSSLFRQPQAVPTTYRPTKTTIQDIQEATKNAEMHKRQDAQRSQSLPPLTRPYNPPEPRPEPRQVAPLPPPPPVQPPRPLTNDEWVGHARLTNPVATGNPSRPTAPVSPSRPAAPASPPAERKGPIRMQLPLGDEAEDGLDAKANSGMSIADAMRNANPKTSDGGDQSKRSKQWGVDMSRFLN